MAAQHGTVVSLQRFPTGMCHYVFDVQLGDGSSVVARVASRDNAAMLRNALSWSRLLRPRGVPLPDVLGAYLETGDDQLPGLVLERLPGDDLGVVYAGLTVGQRAGIAREVAAIQTRAGGLAMGAGFGFVDAPADLGPHPHWGAVVAANVDRSVAWFGDRDVGLDVDALVDRVRSLLTRHEAYFSRVEPWPFLDDITTKNVIVDGGVVRGIVDVDWLCFGDSLFTPALTRASLTGSGLPTDYCEAWLSALELTSAQRAAYDAYTAVHLLGLLSESGLAFNRAAPPPIDGERVARLSEELARLTA